MSLISGEVVGGNFCPYCGYRWDTWQKDAVCDSCVDAMAHFQPPTRRPINATLTIDGQDRRCIIGYYDVNTGEVRSK